MRIVMNTLCALWATIPIKNRFQNATDGIPCRLRPVSSASLGGRVALELAVARPDLVLVLEDAGLPGS
jgi:hypothetical protein